MRSINKGLFIAEHLFKKVKLATANNSKSPIKTWSRASNIIPDIVGLTILVHNGKDHIPVTVQEGMIGHKLGEFSPTRTYKGHKSKSADKKKAKSRR